MRRLFVLIAILMMAGTATADAKPPLVTVPHVDLKQYSGRWYELARYPNWFERGCVAAATATYTPLADGRIGVLNSCRDKSGKEKVSKGKATVADTGTNAKLKVTFLWPFSGNYWVIDLDTGYQLVAVSEPKREYLWVLSRTRTVDPVAYQALFARLQAKGFDLTKLEVSKP